MCGRFALGIDFKLLKTELGVTNHIVHRPRYNIAPGDMVVGMKVPGELEFFSWGFLPKWLQGKPLINARFETISEKTSFSQAYKNQRCVIVATGYYEWASIRGDKHPFYIRNRNNALLYLAGVYDESGCAIITTAAAKSVSKIHPRMPLLLSKPEVNTWLSRFRNKHRDFQPTGFIHDLTFFKVSKRMNAPSFDYPECIESLD